MKKLQLRFKSSDGKNRDLALNFVNENLKEPAVKLAMGKIIESGLFQKNSEQLFSQVLDAKYVERKEDQIFPQE